MAAEMITTLPVKTKPGEAVKIVSDQLPASLTEQGNLKVALMEGQVNVTATESFADANGTPQKALVDSDRHVQVDVLTMPSVSVTLAEKGFSNASDTPTRALVDADRHVQTDVLSFPVTKGDWLSVLPNPSNLDVALSTRASESTLSALKNALASVGTDKVRVSLIDALPAGTNKIGSVDIGNFPTDYAKDATLSSELTRKIKGDQGLLKQVSSTDLRLDVYASYVANPPNLDVALSTRASESTLSGIKAQTDKLTFDSSNRLKVLLESLPNPSNLDVALSTRASEATLSAIKNALASVGTDKMRVSVVDALPAGSNTIGNVYAIKSGTWNIDNLLNPHPVKFTPEEKMQDANQFTGTYAPTAAGSTTIISAVTGKVIRVYDFSLWNSGTADVTVELYFGTSGKRLFKGLLAAKTGVLKSYVRPWESNAGDSLVLALSAAGTCDYCIGAVQA